MYILPFPMLQKLNKIIIWMLIQFLRFSSALCFSTIFLRVGICLAPRRMEKHTTISRQTQLVGPMCHCEYIILPRSFWMWMIFCFFFLFAFVYIGNCESIFGYAYVWMWAHSLRSVWYGFLAKSENMQITCEAQTCNIPWFNSIWFRDFLTILERKCVHFSGIFELYRFLLSDLCCGFLFYFLGLWLPPHLSVRKAHFKCGNKIYSFYKARKK